MKECPGCYSKRIQLDTREVSERPRPLKGGATIQRLAETGWRCLNCGDFWPRR